MESNRKRGNRRFAHIAIAITICWLGLRSAQADITGPNPTPEHPFGWRGDGSGRYPNATPPTTWERRMITPLSELRSVAGKPADEKSASGEPLKRVKGTFQPTEWLMLAPVPGGTDENKTLQEPIVASEATLAPKAGEKLRGLTWKPVRNTIGIDFFQAFGTLEGIHFALLSASIYSPREAEFGFRCEGNHGNWQLYLNGKSENGWDQARHLLHPGWNQMLLKVVLRNRESDSRVEPECYPFPGPQLNYATKNIAWVRQMPGPSFAMPLMVGDKLFVTSEPNDLICLDKMSGKLLWMRSDTLWHAVVGTEPTAVHLESLESLRPLADKLWRLNADYLASGDERLNDLRRKLAQELTEHVKKIDRAYGVSLGWGGGNSTATPCSDGKFVYVWRGETGVLSCHDLEGNLKWCRFQHTGDDAEHGFNSSPIIAGDVIGLIGGARVFGFDRATGRTLWKQRYPHPCYASLVASKIDGQDVFVTPVGMILRAADGKVLQKAFGLYDGECASAALDGDKFYLVARGGFCAAQLPQSMAGDAADSILGRLAPEAIEDMETYPVGSPICDGGLVYFTHSGWTGHHWPILFVVDPKKPQILYSQRLDLTPEIHYAPDGAGVAASLTLGGKNLYVMANRGETIVFKPGTRYEQIAKNTIESIGREGRPEITESTPIFDADRMYYRGEHNLYCISSK